VEISCWCPRGSTTKARSPYSAKAIILICCKTMCVCVVVCLDRDEKWSRWALETTFSLAIYKSSCSALDYFSCPQCEWDECLQRQLHNGSCGLMADLLSKAPSVRHTSSPFLTLSFFPLSRQLITNTDWLCDGMSLCAPVDVRSFVNFSNYLGYLIGSCSWSDTPHVDSREHRRPDRWQRRRSKSAAVTWATAALPESFSLVPIFVKMPVKVFVTHDCTLVFLIETIGPSFLMPDVQDFHDL